MNKMTKDKLFFDLETVADETALVHYPEPLPDARLKDPEKIARSIEEKKAGMIEKAPLNPATTKIVALGFHLGDDSGVFVERENETKLLENFWRLYNDADGRCVGYNILGYDLPVILRRSALLGVLPYGPDVELRRYVDFPITDLMQILSNWNFQKWESLKLVTKLFDLPVEFDEEDSGEFVQYMTDDQLMDYCMKDVSAIWHLYHKMNHVYFSHLGG